MTIRTNKYRVKKGEQTRKAILEAGLKLWPYATPSSIAKELGLTHAAVLWHFKDVRNDIAYYAVATNDKRVINYLTLEGHEAVAGL